MIEARLRATGRLRIVLASAGLLLGLLLLERTTRGVILDELAAALGQVGPSQWGLALCATAVSLWSMGRLDRAVHLWLGTGVETGRARRAGTVAVAIGQVAGFGILSGALARWRALPELDIWRASLVSLVASLTFLAASGLLLVGLLSARDGGAMALGGLLLFGAAMYRAGAVPIVAAAVAITTLDTLMAALVLWSVWHGGPGTSFAAFWAAYLVALWAGLLSQSPGGVGVFEATLVALLPGGATPEALAAFLAYRALYHLGPALLAPLALIRPEQASRLGTAAPDAEARLVARASDPDWGLLVQDGAALTDAAECGGWHRRAMAGQLLLLGRPIGPPAMSDLRQLSRAEGLPLLCYRLDPRSAARARADGWQVMRVGRDAVLDPTTWNPQGAAFRQLRRKLAAAEKAGVEVDIRRPGAVLPLAEMTAIHSAWRAAHGTERGLVMGRFDPALLAGQAVALARVEGRLVGFVSCHVTRAGWALDLMRGGPDAPPGTMQLLVAAAIAAARLDGAPMLSLASVPEPAHPLAMRLTERTRQGLHQFKDSFAPTWQPRYAAAPTAVELAWGLTRVGFATRFPRRPPGTARTRPGRALRLRVILGEFRFEFAPGPCNRVPSGTGLAEAADLPPHKG